MARLREEAIGVGVEEKDEEDDEEKRNESSEHDVAVVGEYALSETDQRSGIERHCWWPEKVEKVAEKRWVPLPAEGSSRRRRRRRRVRVLVIYGNESFLREPRRGLRFSD